MSSKLLACCLVAFMYSASAEANLAELANNIAQRWLVQIDANWQPIRGRCWKGTKGKEIREAMGLAYELDLIEWLNSVEHSDTMSKYEKTYQISKQGIQNRMSNSGYRLDNTSMVNRYWTALTFKKSGSMNVNFIVMKPTELNQYRINVEQGFTNLVGDALKSCLTDARMPTTSLASLVFLVLPQLDDEVVTQVLLATVDAYKRAKNAGEHKVADAWIRRIALQTSVLNATQMRLLKEKVSSDTTRRLVKEIQKQISRIAKKNSTAQAKVFKYWRYHSLLSVLQNTETGRHKTFTETTEFDPKIELSLLEAVELMVLAKRFSEEAQTMEAANILRTLLMWEIGTANTGLQMTRPINKESRVVTPYPLWLALIPAYYELTQKMEEQGGQLTAEQYKTTRMFSRNQYVSGLAEEGFWKNFENVVN